VSIPAPEPARLDSAAQPLRDSSATWFTYLCSTACPSYKTLVPCDNTANGTHSYYHVVSTVAFFITAFDTESVKKSIDNNHPTNAASDACIAKGGTGSKCAYGWFVKATDSGGEIDPNALDTGDTIIQQLG